MTYREEQPSYVDAPCGARAVFDYDTGIGYRCLDCFCILGSVGQPRICQEIADKARKAKDAA